MLAQILYLKSIDCINDVIPPHTSTMKICFWMVSLGTDNEVRCNLVVDTGECTLRENPVPPQMIHGVHSNDPFPDELALQP